MLHKYYKETTCLCRPIDGARVFPCKSRQVIFIFRAGNKMRISHHHPLPLPLPLPLAISGLMQLVSQTHRCRYKYKHGKLNTDALT